MNSLEVREFETAISNFCAQSQLPLEVKRICLEDVLRQIEKDANKEIMEQLKKRSAKNSKKETKKNHEESLSEN